MTLHSRIPRLGASPIASGVQNGDPDPDKNFISRILEAISNIRSEAGQDITHNVDRLVSFLQKPQESGLSTGRKINREISEHPTRSALSLTDTGAVGRGLLEGDPIEFGAGAAGMALGPFASSGMIRRMLSSIKGKIGRGVENLLTSSSPTVRMGASLERAGGMTPARDIINTENIVREEAEIMDLIRADRAEQESLLSSIRKSDFNVSESVDDAFSRLRTGQQGLFEEEARIAKGLTKHEVDVMEGRIAQGFRGPEEVLGMQRNQRLAERMGGDIGELNAPVGIKAPEGSDIANINRRLTRGPSELFEGLEGLEDSGLAVFVKQEGPDARSVVSLTPNPKVPGGWKATIFDEAEGSSSLRNTVDFATREEALEALRGGRKFFEGFTEVPIGTSQSMERFLRRQR